jgi:hypothetical protein
MELLVSVNTRFGQIDSISFCATSPRQYRTRSRRCLTRSTVLPGQTKPPCHSHYLIYAVFGVGHAIRFFRKAMHGRRLALQAVPLRLLVCRGARWTPPCWFPLFFHSQVATTIIGTNTLAI